MSSVRMCDRCGNIFKEGEEDSAMGTITKMVKVGGKTQPVQEAQDICAACSVSIAPVQPQLAGRHEALSLEERYDRIKARIEADAEDMDR